MKEMRMFLSKWGLHSFLLPVFFVFHNYVQYYGLVSGSAAVKVLLEITGIVLLFFLLMLGISKNAARSLQLTTLCSFFVLFYGVIKDFLGDTLRIPFLAKYSVLLPLTIIFVLLLVWRLKKKKDFSRSNLFQNVLLLLFLIAEAIAFFSHETSMYMQRNRLVRGNVLNADSMEVIADKPDVYFLVFDSYPGNSFLKDYLHYDNTALDTALQSKGFHIIKNPRSNYNRTALSMAATMNFEFLQNLPTNQTIEPKQYNQASLSIKHATVPAVFIHQGYHIYNLSCFDLADHPALYRENFLVLPESKMLLYNTLTERFGRDVLWNFHLHGNGYSKIPEKQEKQPGDNAGEDIYEKKDYNDRAADSLLKIPSQNSQQPKFIYAHFYLPHPPFFYDRNGSTIRIDLQTVTQTMEDKDSFISYLEYTNKVMLKIVDTVLKKSLKPPVIILQSDHGYRDFRQDFVSPYQYFKNYNAFYFPGKDYSKLYDTLSNINTFPVLFNQYFKTNIRMQKDTSIFTKY